MNSYIRFKLALTEHEPVIKPYDEAKWALLPDAEAAPLENSLQLLELIHERWMFVLRSLQGDDWNIVYRHPELGPVSLAHAVAMYAWHGNHHVAHITSLRERKGW